MLCGKTSVAEIFTRVKGKSILNKDWNEMIMNGLTDTVPRFLYKYKGIQSINDMDQLFDIIFNHRLYFARYDQLNDPLEGSGGNIGFEAWAGASIIMNADEELYPIEEIKSHYGVLSLSAKPNIQQLWAHYSNNYKGICLCFSTKGLLQSSKKMNYVLDREFIYANSDEEREIAVFNNFFYKHLGWSYEQEWRCVKDIRNDGQFSDFDLDELVGIIIGDKLPISISEMIVKLLPKNIKVMKARPGYQTFQIGLLPWKYTIKYDGSKPDYINDIEEYLTC